MSQKFRGRAFCCDQCDFAGWTQIALTKHQQREHVSSSKLYYGLISELAELREGEDATIEKAEQLRSRFNELLHRSIHDIDPKRPKKEAITAKLVEIEMIIGQLDGT